jgi:hypothetical protein
MDIIHHPRRLHNRVQRALTALCIGCALAPL